MKKYFLFSAPVLLTAVSAQAPDCAAKCLATKWHGCNDPDAVDKINHCVSSSACSDFDKSTIYQALAQSCVNEEASYSATPHASFTATSGAVPEFTGSNGPWSSWTLSTPTSSVDGFDSSSGGTPGGFADPGSVVDSSSLATVSPWGNDGGDWQSWTSANPSAYSSWTSEHSGTAAAFATVTSSPGVPLSGGGLFGGQGWSPFSPSGEWTTGPWTAWWGQSSDGCPPTSWSGWTDGPWGTQPPWTSWNGCTARTTATASISITNSAGTPTVSPSYGYVVNAAADSASSVRGSASPTQNSSGSQTIGVATGGVLLAAVGVIAVAL